MKIKRYMKEYGRAILDHYKAEPYKTRAYIAEYINLVLRRYSQGCLTECEVMSELLAMHFDGAARAAAWYETVPEVPNF